MRRRMLVGGIAVAAWLLAAAAASAQSAPEVFGPWDGANPFRCELQDVGAGTEFPDPGADPFCVEFDKTNQNVTEFGLVEFLAQEPARVAAAVPKCFYFQRDHWTGSIEQGAPPEAWHWDGDYFFDRARGVGGASVRNLRLGGSPMDATPFAPEAYRPFFDPAGGGGAVVELESGPDPVCAARVDTPEERDQVYAGRGIGPACVEPGGPLRGRRIGVTRLGSGRRAALGKLGPPRDHRRGVDRWCLVGKGQLRIEYAGRRGPATLIRSSGRGHALRRVAHGDRARRAARRLALRPLLRLDRTRVLVGARSQRRLGLIAIRAGRVRWVAIADRGRLAGARSLRRAVRRTR